MNTTPDTFMDLFAGYTAIWVVLALFILSLMRQQRALSTQIEQLKKELDSEK